MDEDEQPTFVSRDRATSHHSFLDMAKNHNFEAVFSRLERSKSTLNSTLCGRWSALHQAAFSGKLSVVEQLLEMKADANMVNRQGQTPQEVALDRKHAEVATVLAAAERSHFAYDETIIGYTAVPLKDSHNILRNGYESPSGSVPFSRHKGKAIKHLQESEDSEFSLLLEIRKSEDFEFPHSIKDNQEIILSNDKKHLEKEFLHDGCFCERGAEDYRNARCPYCQSDKDIDWTIPRGRVGMAIYVGGAFMVVPCKNPDCIKKQQDRQNRLDNEPTRMLYHACSRATAEKIKKAGGKFMRGAGGAAGGGIYMSQTPRETWWKAEDGTEFWTGWGAPMMWLAAKDKPSWTADGYVILECEVKVGKELQGSRWQKGLQFADVVHYEGGPFDSVILDRGQTGYPNGRVPNSPVIAETIEETEGGLPEGTLRATRSEDIEAGKAAEPHPGYEWVAYSWDQVKIIRELPFDEMDPPPNYLDQIKKLMT